MTRALSPSDCEEGKGQAEWGDWTDLGAWCSSSWVLVDLASLRLTRDREKPEHPPLHLMLVGRSQLPGKDPALLSMSWVLGSKTGTFQIAP